MSNRDIAESLVFSEGTVGVHVKHILSKLGFRSRRRWRRGGRIKAPKSLQVAAYDGGNRSNTWPVREMPTRRRI
jgi:hypothetical protein